MFSCNKKELNLCQINARLGETPTQDDAMTKLGGDLYKESNKAPLSDMVMVHSDDLQTRLAGGVTLNKSVLMGVTVLCLVSVACTMCSEEARTRVVLTVPAAFNLRESRLTYTQLRKAASR